MTAIARQTKTSPELSLVDVASHHADLLGKQVDKLAQAFHGDRRVLRTFTSTEAAALIGCTDAYLRIMAPSLVVEKDKAGRWAYTLEQIETLRRSLIASRHIGDPHRRPHERTQIIAVANFKGGSGKTTTALHLTQYLALRGYRVLAVDLDPQASLSTMLDNVPDVDTGVDQTMHAAVRFEDPVHTKITIRKTFMAGLDIIPANQELQEFEHEAPHFMANNRQESGKAFMRLPAALQQVQADYDVIVLDCAPNLGFMTLNAMMAATMILVTVHPQMLDVASMSHFMRMFSDLLAVLAKHLKEAPQDILRYVLTRFEPADRPQSQMASLLRTIMPDHVLTAAALKSTAIADAGLGQQSLYEISLTGSDINRTAYSRAIESINDVNAEILSNLKANWGRA